MVAGTHFHGNVLDPEKALSTFEFLAREARQQGARLIVSPERAIDGCIEVQPDQVDLIEQLQSSADTIPGPISDRLGKLAMEIGAYIAFGMLEKNARAYYNSAILISPEGKVVACHRKTQCGVYVHHSEAAVCSEGDRLDVCETEIGTLGLLICYERRAPENARVLALKGADIIITLSAGWGPFETVRARIRAEENGVFYIHVGKHGSTMVGPSGQILSEGRGEDYSGGSYNTCQIDPAMFDDCWCRNGYGQYFKHRRPALYNLLSEPGIEKSIRKIR